MSAPEMGFEQTKSGSEGFRFRLFNDPRMRVVAPTAHAMGRSSDVAYDDCALWYWLRTPVAGSSSTAMVYPAETRFGDINLMNTWPMPVRAISGIRPALNLNSGVAVCDKPDAHGVYSLLFGGVS